MPDPAPAPAAPPLGGLHARQLRELVVRPVLVGLELWSQAAEDLVMGTAAQESRLRYLHQLGAGPALGLWQMEPTTHDDTWSSFIQYRSGLRERVVNACQIVYRAETPPATLLIYNLRYAAAMCRIHYRRVPAPIPGNVDAQAAFWKRHYNTRLGRGTTEEYVRNYRLVA